MFVPLVFALSLPLLHTLVGAFAFAQLASGGLDELELVVVDDLYELFVLLPGLVAADARTQVEEDVYLYGSSDRRLPRPPI